MSHLIPLADVVKYSQGPTAATTASVSSLQNAIRDALGDDFDTFLQGSYKNDTSIRDINDVDIVALRKNVVSVIYSEERYATSVTWAEIFADVEARLRRTTRFAGKVSRGDKCVYVDDSWHADVVPAIRIGNYDQDPIAIYSFRGQAERKNWPRVHYSNGVAKNRSTTGVYKPVVRMFKNWAENHWPANSPAPSFYIECLISNVPDEKFNADLASAFFQVGYWVEQNVKPTAPPFVWSVARDKDILVPSEWRLEEYSRFYNQLYDTTAKVASALQATTQAEARRLWRLAFNE